jgi:hypothetical protein
LFVPLQKNLPDQATFPDLLFSFPSLTPKQSLRIRRRNSIAVDFFLVIASHGPRLGDGVIDGRNSVDPSLRGGPATKQSLESIEIASLRSQ